jgi:hypothetical protein
MHLSPTMPHDTIGVCGHIFIVYADTYIARIGVCGRIYSVHTASQESCIRGAPRATILCRTAATLSSNSNCRNSNSSQLLLRPTATAAERCCSQLLLPQQQLQHSSNCRHSQQQQTALLQQQQLPQQQQQRGRTAMLRVALPRCHTSHASARFGAPQHCCAGNTRALHLHRRHARLPHTPGDGYAIVAKRTRFVSVCVCRQDPDVAENPGGGGGGRRARGGAGGGGGGRWRLPTQTLSVAESAAVSDGQRGAVSREFVSSVCLSSVSAAIRF